MAKFGSNTITGDVVYGGSVHNISTAGSIAFTMNGGLGNNISVGSIANNAFTQSWATSNSQYYCFPPASVPYDWTITSSCMLPNSTFTAKGNIFVKNNSVLIIPSLSKLNIDLTNKHIVVDSGSGILIKTGGAIN